MAASSRPSVSLSDDSISTTFEGGDVQDDVPAAKDEPAKTAKKPKTRELLLLASPNFLLFPYIVVPVNLPDHVARAFQDTELENTEVFISPLLERERLDRNVPILDQISRVGSIAMVLKSLRSADGQLRVLLHGGRRARALSARYKKNAPSVKIEEVHDVEPEADQGEALRRSVLKVLQKVIEMSSIPDEVFQTARGITDIGRLADLVASHLTLPIETQVDLLNEFDVLKRIERVYALLMREERVLEITHKIQSKARGEIEQTQREFFLREQMRQIRGELGEKPDVLDDAEELRQRLTKKEMPQAARDVAEKEIGRLERINVASPEYTVARTYVDWLLTMPWVETAPVVTDIALAKQVLDEDHYDLSEVKDRILEFLSVMKLTKGHQAPLLCLVGPPGTGKTSLGKSIARATGRPFHRFSLGGMRDEAEIRGHRRTYIGAMPGRIVKAIKLAAVKNPVIMLDEVDKIGMDFRGDPASALLEVLDPEQNSNFIDNYLEVPFDLSGVLFITTANLLDPIPAPLRDRMEVIRLGGYTTSEKLEIARRYVVPRQLKANGLSQRQIRFGKDGLLGIIERYTRESGLRELDRLVAQVCRKVARTVAEGNTKAVSVGKSSLQRYLGPPRHLDELAHRVWRPGIATGLAWTQVGGEMLFIEVNKMPGKGKVVMTGQLGDVMKESATAAISYLQTHSAALGLSPKIFEEHDIHVHLPAGATPKDGPSAGIAMACAILSELLGVEVDRHTAMTGEITLKGQVLPIGGLKEKSLAAARAGIKQLILPEENRADLDKVPDEVKAKLEFKFVREMGEVLAMALPKGNFAWLPGEKRKSAKRRTAKSADARVPATT